MNVFATIDTDTIISIILNVLGGIGIFLFGIEVMGNALKALAGNRMKTIIEKTTNTPLKGILVGALVTVIIQSSSGTTALTVSLVRSGLMTLPQAVGIIMGANIGTTMTAFLVGLDIQKYALGFIGLGAFMLFFISNNRAKTYGHAVLGFGMLFFGLELMSDGLSLVIDTYQSEAELLFQMLAEQPILGMTIGAIITAVVQSSSAAIGILQNLYADGNIALIGAIPILLGSNIGTTITAMLASVGGTKEAKQTAVIHVLFNVFGSILFLILLVPYSYLVGQIETIFLVPVLGETPKMTLAIAHLIFNVVSTMIMFFFIKQLVAIAQKVIKDDEEPLELRDFLLDTDLADQSPTLALELVKKSIDYMGQQATEFFTTTRNFSVTYDSRSITTSDKNEQIINSLDKRIHDYLTQLIRTDIDRDESVLVSKYMDTIRDIERIGDHCSNLIEFFDENHKNNLVYSENCKKDLDEMFNKVNQMVVLSLDSLITADKSRAILVIELEKEVDDLEIKFRKRHFIRMNKELCTEFATNNYVEILANLERIADHCNNIASNVLSDEYCKETEYAH